MRSSSNRYTTLSDRFRTLWTFHQFLRGVLKHLGQGPMPFSYDFHATHSELKELTHTVGIEHVEDGDPELDRLEREIDQIQGALAGVDKGLKPSVMRTFFDHVKRQDERTLPELIKFYLLSEHFEQDTLDKLDILFTRFAEEPSADSAVASRDPAELLQKFVSLYEFINLAPLPLAEETPLIEAVIEIRKELESIEDQSAAVASKVYERYRRLKQRLGTTALHPSLLVEITTTNIVAKRRFKELFSSEDTAGTGHTSRTDDIEIPAPTAAVDLTPDRADAARSPLKERESHRPPQRASLADVLPLDPLLNESLHKIMFALEMVVWDRLPTLVAEAPEIRNLNLESWEVETYRNLAERKVEEGSTEWELARFILSVAALRVKMEEEHDEISRLETASHPDHLFDALEHSAQSLERAREMDRRFQWFIDDMVFRGETSHLEPLYRSRFRFLHAYSGLWLVHQRSGGLTPL